jgi:hypothetical protein
MDLTVSIHASVSRLLFDPVMHRRTVYATVTLGKRVFWVMRWDTQRCMPSAYNAGRPKPKPFAFSRDKLMCWTCGTR